MISCGKCCVQSIKRTHTQRERGSSCVMEKNNFCNDGNTFYWFMPGMLWWGFEIEENRLKSIDLLCHIEYERVSESTWW